MRSIRIWAMTVLCFLGLADALSAQQAEGENPPLTVSDLLARAKRHIDRYNLPRAVQLLEAVHRLDPKHREARLLLARVESHLGHHDRAMAHCRVVLGSSSSDVEAICLFGDLLNRAHQPEAALATIKGLLAQNPDEVRALNV